MTPAEVIAQQPKAARPIKEVIVHCTATREGQPFTVADIRAWHLARGWNDIGYHYVVMLDGSLEPGRPESIVGAHVAGHNTGTLGIVYVGGVAADGKTPKDTRTPAQRKALMDAVAALIAKYPTITKVSGHNEYAAKACPSFNVQADPLSKLPAGAVVAPAPPLVATEIPPRQSFMDWFIGLIRQDLTFGAKPFRRPSVTGNGPLRRSKGSHHDRISHPPGHPVRRDAL